MITQSQATKIVNQIKDGETIDVNSISEKREIYYTYARWSVRNAKTKTFTVTVNGVDVGKNGVPLQSPTWDEFIAMAQGNSVPCQEVVGSRIRWHSAMAWRHLVTYGEFGDPGELVQSVTWIKKVLADAGREFSGVNRQPSDKSNATINDVLLTLEGWMTRLEDQETERPRLSSPITESELEHFRCLLDALPQPPGKS